MADDIFTQETVDKLNSSALTFNEVVTSRAGGVSTGSLIDQTLTPLGDVTDTLKGRLDKIGTTFTDWGSTEGGTLTSASQAFLNNTTGSAGIGNYYAWTGAFPHIVTPGLDPAVTAGYAIRSNAQFFSAVTQTNDGASVSEPSLDDLRDIARRDSAGYTLIGNSTIGCTLTGPRQTVKVLATGEEYEWTGSFDKVVAPNDVTVGVDAGWVNRTGVVTKHHFRSVADMLSAGGLLLGTFVECEQFHDGVTLPSPNQYKITTDTPDGMFVIDLGGGLSATLQNYSRQLFIERIGAKPDLYTDETTGTINPAKTDNWPIFNAVKTLRAGILAFGAYYLSQKLDLGNGDTENFGAIRGLINRNFDGKQSVLAFDSTDGIEVFAGASLHDFTVINIGATKTGLGLKADNVHGAKISNITATNFAQGADLFLWASQCERVIAYQCTAGVKITNESTSTTYSSCYSRECVTGFDLSGAFTYSTLLNCAADDCDIPYLFRGGSNVDLNNCGAEIGHANITGFFKFETDEAAATVSISGGRYVMLNGMTCESIAYAPVGATNGFGRILFSRINTNSFTSPVSGFVKGTVRAVISNGCTFSDTFNLRVAGSDTGSLIMDYRSGTGTNHCVRVPVVAGVNTGGQAVRSKVVIERFIDFQAAIEASDQVYIKTYTTESGAAMQIKVECWPAGSAAHSYHEWAAWTVGGGAGGGVNIIGTQFSSSQFSTDGFRSFVFSRSALQGKAYVRVTIEGLADSGYRDVMAALIIGAL